MKFVAATVMVILVTVTTESWAANKTTTSESSGITKTSDTKVPAKPSRSLFLPKTSTSVSYYPKRTVRVSSSTSNFPQPTYAPKTTTTTTTSYNSTDIDDEDIDISDLSITTTTSTTPPPKSQDKKMDRSGLADASDTALYQPAVRRTTVEDDLSVYVPDNLTLQKLNADRKSSSYLGKSSYRHGSESTSTKLNTSPVTILVHASPDKLPKIKPKRKNLSVTPPTKKRSDFKTTYSTMYPASSTSYNTKSYQTSTPSYKSSPYRSRPVPALPATASPYTSSSSNYETTMSPNYHSGETSTIPTTQAGLVNYMVRNLLMQANVMNQLLPLVQQIASQVPSVLADVEAAKNQLAFSQAKDELSSTLNTAVNQYNSNNNNGGKVKVKRPPQSYSSPATASSSNVYHQDNRNTNYYTSTKHKPTSTTRSYSQSKTNTGFKPVALNKFDPSFSSMRPMNHQEDFYQTEDQFPEEDHYRPYASVSHEKAKVTQGPYSSLQVGNKEYTLPTFKISLNTEYSGQSRGNKVALGERPYFTMGDGDHGRPGDHRTAESFAKNSYYEGGLPKSTATMVNSVVPIVLQLHHSRKQKERDPSPSVIKVVEVKETRSSNPHAPSPTIVEVVEEKEERKQANPVIQVIEVKDGKRQPPQHHFYENHDQGQESIMSVEEKSPQSSLDQKYEELKKAVLKEAAFREATFKEAARIVKNLQHMDSSTAFDRLPDAIKDQAFHHHGEIEDHFEHSASGRPGNIVGPFHKPNNDRFKDFFDESERFKDGMKMSSDDLGQAMSKHHNNQHSHDSSFAEIAHRLRNSQKDSIPLPPNPESLGLEGTQLEILKEAIAKAMEEEKKGGKPKEIHVMPQPLDNHHHKHNSDDDLLKLLSSDHHKVSNKPKIHLIPLKNKKEMEHHGIEFHSFEDASPQNAASLSEETKKVLEAYSAIDVIRPNPMMNPHPFPGMHRPPFPFPRMPMPGPFPHHGPMPPRPMPGPYPFPPRPFPPRPFPMGPFPYGHGPGHPHGPPRGPFPHPPMLPPHRPPMGPFPRPPLPHLPPPPPPPFKKRSGEDEEEPKEVEDKDKDKDKKKDNVEEAKTEVKP